MGIADHLTCLLRNPYAGQEATVRTEHGTRDWFQIGKGIHQGVQGVHPAYLTYMQSTSCKCHTGWSTSWNRDFQDKYQYLRYEDDTNLMAENEGSKEPVDKSERWEWKAGLKLNIQKTKILAYGPITSQQIHGKTVETVTDFIFLGSKITADGDCSHEIKRHLLLGWENMTNLDSILKSRGIILLTKVHLVKAMVFPIVMYGCESWTIKKAEHQRTEAFELWYWRRLLRVPWTARSNQSIIKETRP